MVTVTSTVKVSGTSEITLSFDTRTEALLAQTGSSKFIQIGDLRYAYDASGTALTTGDLRTWSLVSELRFDTYADFSAGAEDWYPVGTVVRVGSMRYKVVASGGSITVGTLQYVEAGSTFTSYERAEAGDTLGETLIEVSGSFYELDASGTSLTTGDGETWTSIGVASLRSFGAVGDGVADDTAALQRAYMSGLILYDEGGTYRQVGAVTARHPLVFEGAGPGKTAFIYEGMGGYDGLNGITLQITTPGAIGTSSLGSESSFTGATIKITGANGATWFKTPVAQADVWTQVKPRYRLSDLYFTGDNAGDAAYFELNTTAWECCIDLGEGNNHVVTRITGAGNYDFRAEPTATAIRSTFLRMGGAEAGPGGILTPGVSHLWLQHFGTAIDIGWRIVRAQFHEIAVHLGWRGLYSPNPRTGANYGLDELEMSDTNINVQSRGFYAIGFSGGMTLENVDVTRASGGFDHGTGFTGVEIIDSIRLTLKGGRAYTAATTSEYSDTTIGYRLEGIRNLEAGGMLLRSEGTDQMQNGVIIVDPGKVTLSGLAVDGSVIDLLTLNGTPQSIAEVTLAGVPHSSVVTGNRITYGGTVTRKIVNDLDEIEDVDASNTTLSAAGSENYTPGVSSKWRRYAVAAGAGAFTYDINMLSTGAREGDEVEFTFTATGTNGTVRILDASAAVQYSKTVASGSVYWVRGRYLGSSPALFRITAHGINS